MLYTVLANNKLWWRGLKFNNLFLLDTSVHHFKMAAFEITLLTGFPEIFAAKLVIVTCFTTNKYVLHFDKITCHRKKNCCKL